MSQLTKLGNLTNDMVSAHRERSRLFDRLADPRVEDERRQQLIDEYAEASANFEKARKAVLSAAKTNTAK